MEYVTDNTVIRASQILQSFAARLQEETVSLRQITETLQQEGFHILLLMFALPMALPLPWPPGFSSLVSLPLLLISAQMALGWSAIRMPEFVGKKRVSRSSVQTVVNKSMPYLMETEYYLKPRMAMLFNAKTDRVVGAFSFILAVCIALPFSFLTNTIPAAGITLMMLGLLMRDGVVLLGGIVAGLIGLAITIGILLLGAEFLQYLWQ